MNSELIRAILPSVSAVRPRRPTAKFWSLHILSFFSPSLNCRDSFPRSVVFWSHRSASSQPWRLPLRTRARLARQTSFCISGAPLCRCIAPSPETLAGYTRDREREREGSSGWGSVLSRRNSYPVRQSMQCQNQSVMNCKSSSSKQTLLHLPSN